MRGRPCWSAGIGRDAPPSVVDSPSWTFHAQPAWRSLDREADFSFPLGRSRQTFGSLSTHRLDNDSRVERSPS